MPPSTPDRCTATATALSSRSVARLMLRVVGRIERRHALNDPQAATRLAAEYVGVVDEARRVKIAKTEAFYRSVNENIESLNEDFAPILQTMIVICECG